MIIKEGFMNWKDERKSLAGFVAVFFLLYFLPVGSPRFDGAITEALELTKMVHTRTYSAVSYTSPIYCRRDIRLCQPGISNEILWRKG